MTKKGEEPAPVTTYPQYSVDLDAATMDTIAGVAIKLLTEVGLIVSHEPFMARMQWKTGLVMRGERVCFERALVKESLAAWRRTRRERYEKAAKQDAAASKREWKVLSGGFSMDVIDIDTDAVRPATCKDLAELTRLADSYDMGGPNIVQPQDVRPIMRDMAACRGSFENGRNFITSCHSASSQTPYLVDMFKVAGQTFPALMITAPPMRVAPESLEELLYLVDHRWDDIEAGHVRLEPMIYNAPGVSGPITVSGCKGLAFTEGLGMHILLKLFDERINLPIGAGIWHPCDLRHANYAHGSPRAHLFRYLNHRWMPAMCGFVTDTYQTPNGSLSTSSCQLDEQAGLEKMATALMSALQGARTFSGAGNLCVDDLFSAVQLVLDVELVEYIRELVESFDPAPEITSMDGMYDAIVGVVNGKDMFMSHETTVRMFRDFMPSSNILHREKLRSWQSHGKTARDHAREVARERIRTHEFRLNDDQLKELARLYEKA
ncbi:MAG: trimethylamine methyltransferase family protein, partial [Planctomycetes bacterium]|nr:trimethylamine methyltransferase family protein [Planctomycetota bacterium]